MKLLITGLNNGVAAAEAEPKPSTSIDKPVRESDAEHLSDACACLRTCFKEAVRVTGIRCTHEQVWLPQILLVIWRHRVQSVCAQAHTPPSASRKASKNNINASSTVEILQLILRRMALG